jgi:hypothetical protein
VIAVGRFAAVLVADADEQGVKFVKERGLGRKLRLETSLDRFVVRLRVYAASTRK